MLDQCPTPPPDLQLRLGSGSQQHPRPGQKRPINLAAYPHLRIHKRAVLEHQKSWNHNRTNGKHPTDFASMSLPQSPTSLGHFLVSSCLFNVQSYTYVPCSIYYTDIGNQERLCPLPWCAAYIRKRPCSTLSTSSSLSVCSLDGTPATPASLLLNIDVSFVDAVNADLGDYCPAILHGVSQDTSISVQGDSCDIHSIRAYVDATRNGLARYQLPYIGPLADQYVTEE